MLFRVLGQVEVISSESLTGTGKRNQSPRHSPTNTTSEGNIDDRIAAQVIMVPEVFLRAVIYCEAGSTCGDRLREPQ
jgi:hypothetical protein